VDQTLRGGRGDDLGVPLVLLQKKGRAKLETKLVLFGELKVGDEYFIEHDHERRTLYQKIGPETCQALIRSVLHKQDPDQLVQRIIRRDE